MMSRVLLCMLSFLLPILWLGAQEEPPGDVYLGDTIVTHADLFGEGEPLEMTLTFDIKHYARRKFKGEYQPVELILHVNDTLTVEK